MLRSLTLCVLGLLCGPSLAQKCKTPTLRLVPGGGSSWVVESKVPNGHSLPIAWVFFGPAGRPIGTTPPVIMRVCYGWPFWRGGVLRLRIPRPTGWLKPRLFRVGVIHFADCGAGAEFPIVQKDLTFFPAG